MSYVILERDCNSKYLTRDSDSDCPDLKTERPFPSHGMFKFFFKE